MTTSAAQKTHRQTTRVAVRIDSHLANAIDVSRDVVSLSTEKGIKSKGSFQLHLVPRRNYFNTIFPNDIVNIYIDPGDGERGFVRTMMGFVDRIERQESTDSEGSVSSHFVVIGSDFQKAIEETAIYFNQFLRDRLDARFNKLNIAGTALRSAGIVGSGTPADYVTNFLRILLGFGQQWVLPESYPASSNKQSIRDGKAQQAKANIPESLKQLLETIGVNGEFITNDIEEIIQKSKAARAASNTSIGGEVETDEEFNARLTRVAATLQGASPLQAYRQALNTSESTLPPGLADLLDTRLVEHACIDGFTANSEVWNTENSTLAQFLNGHTNEIVNELMFDLRPVTRDEYDGSPTSDYSKEADDTGINAKGTEMFPLSVPAVQYVPSVVFREFPYSVCKGFDASTLTLFGGPTPNSGGQSEFGELVRFGPVFAVNPNCPGRQTYDYGEVGKSKGITALPGLLGDNVRGIKHIDVVVIEDTDVTHSSLGRSDNDIYNLFELTAHNFGQLAEHYKYLLSNFSPILNPISVARHGLRVRQMSTDFANYGIGSGIGPDLALDGTSVRRNLTRWLLLVDHWFQHNAEYLSGTISLRGMPEIRAGYRLDWKGRNESYYVDSVSNNWQYPQQLTTTVQVSRGQRNDPFPAFVPPIFLDTRGVRDGNTSGDRSEDGRLAAYFPVKDTHGTYGAVDKIEEDYSKGKLGVEDPSGTGENIIDRPGNANGKGKAEYAYPNDINLAKYQLTLSDGPGSFGPARPPLHGLVDSKLTLDQTKFNGSGDDD